MSASEEISQDSSVPVRRLRLLLEVIALGLAIAAVLSLVSSIVGALDAVSSQGNSVTGSERLMWVSRVLGTPYAVLLALLAILSLAISRATNEPETGKSETRGIAILVFAGVSAIAVLLASVHAVLRVLLDPDNGILAEDSGGSRFAGLAQYLAAFTLALVTAWAAARLWSSTDYDEDDESEEVTDVETEPGSATDPDLP